LIPHKNSSNGSLNNPMTKKQQKISFKRFITETSTVQVNAAIDYLIERNANFTKPFVEINPFLLKTMKIS